MESARKGDVDDSKRSSGLTSLKWIIQGTIVIPTGNPFDSESQGAKGQEDIAEQENCLWLGPGLKLLLNHVLGVNDNGIIVWIAPVAESEELLVAADIQTRSAKVIQLSPREFLCPGLIDLHIHAPQFAYTGTATDRPLTGPDGWLETYTFPAESRLHNDPDLARQVYQSVVRTTLQAGTTTAVYFGTLHLKPNQILVDCALELGQRALVGKVCMDRNSPDNYCQTLDENLNETKELIEYIQNHPQNNVAQDKKTPLLVLPLITPRFIPTCTPELLTALGTLVSQYQCHVTSHISESIDEVAWSRALDKEDHGTERTDASIFHAHGLLTNRCIMAHGVHLSDEDLDLLNQQNSAIAHCPLSNFFFAGKHLHCDHVMRKLRGKVGLGTDVAGGYSPSMMHSARMAVLASQALRIQETQEAPPLDYRHTVYLATLGGAKALGLQDVIGTFRVGMEFDAMILSAGETAGRNAVPIFPDHDSLSDIFQKLWVLGDDRNITHVFVRGREVKRSLS